MEMTTNEIVRMYKEAADKKNQINILADMNLCTPDDIRAELIKGGIDARTLPRKRRKPNGGGGNNCGTRNRSHFGRGTERR